MSTHKSLRIRSDFPSGNGKDFQEIKPDHWTMELEGDFIYGPWYYVEFEENAAEEREVELKILGIPSTPDLLQAECPVIKVNEGEWQKLPQERVSIENTDKTGIFETPVLFFWEQGKKVPKDRKATHLLSNICLKLHIPANSRLRLATTYPYTYGHLLKWLNALSKGNGPLAKYIKVKSVGKSEEGRDIPVVILTNFKKKKKKRRIFITARMHPCLEASGSWGTEKIVEFLLGGSRHSRELLNQFVFSIIPMVNVDGVHKGNPHYNARGVDIWIDFNGRKSKEAQEVFDFMINFKPEFYIDLHGWLSHDKGRWPFDGAYIDTIGVDSFDRDYYIRMIECLKNKIEGFASYALYRFVVPESSIAVAYRELHALGCVLEINPSFSSVYSVKKRTLNSFLGICDFLLQNPLPGGS